MIAKTPECGGIAPRFRSQMQLRRCEIAHQQYDSRDSELKEKVFE
jgi:hypothetical protein